MSERTRDAGVTLVELILSMALSLLVLTVLIAVFGSASNTQAATKNRDVAAGAAQVAMTSIQTSIRNSSSFSITGNVLRARVAIGDGTGWQCRAWALTSSGDLVYLRSSTTIAVPSSYASWTLLATKVTGTLTSAAVFAAEGASGQKLKYGFAVTVGSSPTQARVPVEGGAVAQAKGSGSPASCW